MEINSTDNVHSINSEHETKTIPGSKEWKKPPSVSDLKQDLTDARADRDSQVVKITEYLDYLNLTGKAKPKKRDGYSAVAPKLIRKQAEWRYASLSEPFLSTDDIFNTDPITYEDKKGAIQNGIVLNNQFNTKLDKIRFIDEYVRAAVDEGTVFVRVGWDSEEKEVEVPNYVYQETTDPSAAEIHNQLHTLMAEDENRYLIEVPQPLQRAHTITMETGKIVLPVESGTRKVMQSVKNQPTLEVCDYRSLVIDPTCKGDLTKANFIIYDFESSLAELKKDGKYHNLDNINLTEGNVLNSPDHTVDDEPSFTFKDKARQKLAVHEYWGFWDIEDNGELVPIVAAWVGRTMIRLEKNPYPDQKLPYVGVQLLPRRNSVYGEPDGALLKDNQDIIGAVTRGMVDIMGRTAAGQQGSRKDALDITNRRKYQNGEDYEFNPGVSPEQAFYVHKHPEIPQSAQYMLDLQNTDAESLTGVKGFHSGISGAALGNTATGIRSALDATSKRELGILRRLAEGMKEIGRKIVSMNAEFLSEVEVVRMTNEEFVAVRRDDLGGEYDLRLTISTAEADNQKGEELAFMLQTIGNNMDPAISQTLLAEIARLRKMPDLAKRVEEYQPQPDPLEEEMKLLQVELLRAQVETERSKSIENQANAELDLAKASTEEAKAQNLGSDTDLKNLDFLEQESGTNQERELQKQDRVNQGKLEQQVVADAIKAQQEQRAERPANAL